MQPKVARGDSEKLATALGEFDECAGRWLEHLHPQWLPVVGWESSQTSACSMPALSLLAYRRVCGPLPSVAALMHPLGRWCTLPASKLRQRLAVLALARRPGVVRGCLRRSDRLALAELAGHGYGALQARAADACGSAADVASYSAEGWAWTGYRDVSSSGAWPMRSLRRWARLSLPCRPIEATSVAPSRVPVAEAVSLVDQWLSGAP